MPRFLCPSEVIGTVNKTQMLAAGSLVFIAEQASFALDHGREKQGGVVWFQLDSREGVAPKSDSGWVYE